MRILLVEDDAQLGRAIQIGLEQDVNTVDWVHDAQSAETAVKTHRYAAILLDLGLPGLDGMSLLRKMRTMGVDSAILIVTARGQVTDRIAGLDQGADDFIIKPFDLDELSARIRAAVRRSSGRANNIIELGELRIDTTRRHVFKSGGVIALTAREFSVLLDLVEHAGQIRSRTQLEECLYGWGEEVESNSIEVHVHHLRKKLGRTLIKTVHGIGYLVDGA